MRDIKPPEENMVNGLIYIKEKVADTQISPFTTTCTKSGGLLRFRKADQTIGKEFNWSINSKGVIDAIGITSCIYAGFMKAQR